MIIYRNPSGSVCGGVGSTGGTKGGSREASGKTAAFLLVRKDHHSDPDRGSGIERNI